MGSKIWRIVGAAFVGMLGFGAVIPMLPVYLREHAGAYTFLTGLFLAPTIFRVGAAAAAGANGWPA